MWAKLKVLELFGGIGACSKAEKLGITEIADYVEIDKYAVKELLMQYIIQTFEPQDITQWDKDIWFNYAWKLSRFFVSWITTGGDEGSGTRSV